MKIETTKNFTVNKNTFSKQSAGANENLNTAGGEIEGADDSGLSSDFARVLENLGNKENKSESKKVNSTKTNTHEDNAQTNAKINPKTNSKHDFDDKNQNDKLKDEQPREDAIAAVNARAANGESFAIETETSVPPARSILHIADLERIVSSVRSTAFDGQNQVTITLKNSVLKGLQIKLTADENKRITAEFVAANEKVKTQIDARSGELADLLRRRGINLTSLQTAVGAETSGGNNNNNSAYQTADLLNAIKTSPRALTSENVSSEIFDAAETIESEGNTYRV